MASRAMTLYGRKSGLKAAPPEHAMVSMELDDEEKLDACQPIPCDKPNYPYGLRICLTDAEFTKLKIDPSEASVGATFHICGEVRITSASFSDGEYGPSCRVEGQIEMLHIDSDDDDD